MKLQCFKVLEFFYCLEVGVNQEFNDLKFDETKTLNFIN